MRSSLALVAAVGMAFIGCGGTGSTDGAGGSGSSSTSAAGMGGGAVSSSASSTSSGSSASSGSGSSGSGVDGGALGPVVTILHPGSGVDRKVNVSIYFHGTGVDPTDGMLTGNALVWTDNLEGQFGTGDPVNWAPTKVGAHVITLTGTDSLNYSSSDMVMFNIVP